MTSFNKRISKRKESKVTLKNHKKHTDASSQELAEQGTTAAVPVRPEDIKMHS
jgi:hypothetical protein